MKIQPEVSGTRSPGFDFSTFTWFFAMAVLFQLARGDMGLFASLRSTPDGITFGDGPVPQLWFLCALLALGWPHRVWSLVLLGAAGLADFQSRLPATVPSICAQRVDRFLPPAAAVLHSVPADRQCVQAAVRLPDRRR